MIANRVLWLLLVLGLASTAGALERAYEQVEVGGRNNIVEVNAHACNATDGCFARGGLPCNTSPNDRCDYQRVPLGRCSGGTGSCIWPLGGGTCVSNSAVACIADPPNDMATDDNGDPGYPSVMCADLASDGCDMTTNLNACRCQGDDPSAAEWEGDICSGVSPSVQARCSDGDPGDIGGFGLAVCQISEVGLIEVNCGDTSVQNLTRDGPRYGYENPPNRVTAQRLPGLTPPTPDSPIIGVASTAALDLDEHNTGPYASVNGRLVQVLGDSWHADWTFSANLDSGGFDANVVPFYCNPPVFWRVNLPVEGICEPASPPGTFGGEFCVEDRDCPGNGPEGDTCTPLLYCHENAFDGFGHLWERNLSTAELAANPTCPPNCGRAADFHTGELEAFLNAQALSPRAGVQLALDHFEGARAGEGNLHLIQPIVKHFWITSGDNRCFIGGNPSVIGDTDGDGLSDVDTCDLVNFVCGDGVTTCLGLGECPAKRGRCDDSTGRSCDLAIGGEAECGAGIKCRPCGGTLGNSDCTGPGTPNACCTGAASGTCHTTGPGGNCVDCVFTDAANGNSFALPIGYEDHAPLPGLSLFGRIGGLADKESSFRFPLPSVGTNGPARSQFRDDTCQPEGSRDTCKLGQDSGPLVSGVGTGGVFLSSFVPPIDPLGGPLGVDVPWLAEGTGATCTGCLVVRDYAPGGDGIPGCLGDNEAANGTILPCDLVLGVGPSGSTGTDDPELTADYGTGGAPDIRSSTVSRFLVSDPTRNTPVMNTTTALALRDVSLFLPQNTDLMLKTSATWCPILGNCSATTGLECQIDADCPGSETCGNQVANCARQPYCGTLCGLNSTDPAVDTDGDGAFVCLADDPCPDFSNTLPINGGGASDPNGDPNGDGIPNECQCGDINLDGLISSRDAINAFNCIAPPNLPAEICDPPVLAGLGDANNNGQYDTQDALFIFNSQPGKPLGPSFMTCPNRPPPGGGPGNPGPALVVPPGC